MEPEAEKAEKRRLLEAVLRSCNKSMVQMRRSKRKLQILEATIDALFKSGDISEFRRTVEKEGLRRTRADAECCLRLIYERMRQVRLELRRLH